MMHDDEISPTVREVLEGVPRWYESWGTSLVAIVFFGLLGMAGLIRYPDVVTARLTIAPAISPAGEVVGHAELPVAGSGKVRTGQTVRIKLDHYPYPQFGGLMGEVASIAKVPGRESYRLTVKLPHGMRTNTNPSIAFKPPMGGEAQILTAELSLLERIFFQLRLSVTQPL